MGGERGPRRSGRAGEWLRGRMNLNFGAPLVALLTILADVSGSSTQCSLHDIHLYCVASTNIGKKMFREELAAYMYRHSKCFSKMPDKLKACRVTEGTLHAV